LKRKEHTQRIIGASFGESGPDHVAVIVEGPDSYGYALVGRDGLVEPLGPRGSFPKGGIYGDDTRRFLAILGKLDPEAQGLKSFIPLAGGSVSQADADDLFRWQREYLTNTFC
jgi:hypothetical protein